MLLEKNTEGAKNPGIKLKTDTLQPDFRRTRQNNVTARAYVGPLTGRLVGEGTRAVLVTPGESRQIAPLCFWHRTDELATTRLFPL